MSEWKLQGKLAVVTGANSGIGLPTVVALAKAGARVLFTARSRQKGEAARSRILSEAGVPAEQVQLELLDLADLAGVRRFALGLREREPQLKLLVNNAGLIVGSRRQTVDGFEETFAVNHLGPYLLTRLLEPALLASDSARIVNVASEAHRRRGGLDIDDLQLLRRGYEPFLAYSRSKLMNLLFTLHHAERLRDTSVTVNAVHPGVVNTGFAKDGDLGGLMGFAAGLFFRFMLTPEQGARCTVYAATAPELVSVSGRYFNACRSAQPSRHALDREMAQRLWVESERLVSAYLDQ